MPIQSGTWKRLPAKEVLLEKIEEQKRHNADLSTYLWYVMPLAGKFGDTVYDVAAKSLTESDIEVSGSQLKQLAEELSTPAGMQRYAAARRHHLFGHVTG